MNDHKVFRLLMETNPVPDPDGLDSPLALTELERRSPTMAANQPRDGNRSRRLLIGAVAAVAVLVVGLGSWAAFADDDGSVPTTAAAAAATTTTSPSTTGAPTTATSPSEAESLALATVTAYYDALDSGDIPAMLEMGTDTYRRDTQELRHVAIVAEASERAVLVEPCGVVGPNAAEDRWVVKCTVSYSNDYHGPGGVDYVEPRIATFVVTNDGKINGYYDSAGRPETDPANPANYFVYNAAFYDWLEVAHPEVAVQIMADDGESIPGWLSGDPGDMTIAVQYVEEFVAQSDVYPLEPDDG